MNGAGRGGRGAAERILQRTNSSPRPPSPDRGVGRRSPAPPSSRAPRSPSVSPPPNGARVASPDPSEAAARDEEEYRPLLSPDHPDEDSSDARRADDPSWIGVAGLDDIGVAGLDGDDDAAHDDRVPSPAPPPREEKRSTARAARAREPSSEPEAPAPPEPPALSAPKPRAHRQSPAVPTAPSASADGAPVVPEPKAADPSVKTIAWSKSKRKRAEEGGDGGSESTSSAFGVKSFEEIMREKRARQQQG